MDLITCKGLIKRSISVCLLLLLCNSAAFATTYTFSGGPPGTITPAGPNGETSPPVPNSTLGTQFANGDTAHIVSGANIATPSGSGLPYTIGVTDTSAVNGISLNLNLDQGGTLSYAGNVASGAAFYSSRADNQGTTSTFNINGNISSGTGLYAMYFTNNNAAPQGTYNINVGSTASISGAVVTTGVFAANLNISGSPNIQGVISLGTSALGLSTLTVGQPSTANFTTTQTLSYIGLLHITNNSTMTINGATNSINNVAVDVGSTLTIHSNLVGIGAVDGNIVNNGTMNIAANISKTGTFAGSGTNIIMQGAATPLTVATSTYQVATHVVSMVDIYNYGNMSLTSTVPPANFNLSGGAVFRVAYGQYGTAGFLTSGVYTLVSTNGTVTAPAITTIPTNTLFETFSNLVFNAHNIQITVTRTPFQTYAMTNLTRSIAQNLEVIGANSPTASSVQLLDAVNASTSTQQLEYALRSLAPLSNAPFYGYIIQNECLNQVKLRLAELRNREYYFAGSEDIGKDNHVWIRPFGSYGNQLPKQDSLGYYASLGGIAAGFDRNLDDRYTMGGAFAYALAHVKDKINPQSVTNLKSYILMVYGTYNFDPLTYLDWVMGVTANNFAASRLVNINGLYTATATSSYSSQQIAFLGQWGKDFEAFGFMQLTEQAMAELSFSKQYTYTETGAQAANLTISRTNSAVVTLGLGGVASIPLLADPGVVVPDIHGMLYYNPVVGKQNTIFNFVAGGGAITSIMDLSRTALRVGAALTIAVVDKLEVKMDFDYQIANKFNGWYTFLNLRYSL